MGLAYVFDLDGGKKVSCLVLTLNYHQMTGFLHEVPYIYSRTRDTFIPVTYNVKVKDQDRGTRLKCVGELKFKKLNRFHQVKKRVI